MIQLYNDDCLKVLPTLPDKSVDMILTDPPYGTTACKWDCVIDFDLMWRELNRVIKPKGCIALFGSEPFSSALRMSNIKNYKYDWIWNKRKGGNPLMSRVQPIKITENIMIFAKNSTYYYPIKTKRDKPKARGKNKGNLSQATNTAFTENKVYTDLYPKNILDFSNANQQCKLHPTQKPVPLLEYLIKTYTLENETILDFTMGSGSTGVACTNTNRNFIGIERDSKYFIIAKDRIENAKTNTL